MYYVYILRSALNRSYYIGSCKNITNRFNQHNKGNVLSTRKGKPWELVYREEYDTLKEARKREIQIKRWKSRYAIEKLLGRS